MSPEQYVGVANHISVASDVYGLEAVLYAALCDQPIRTPDQMRLVPDWSLIRSAPGRFDGSVTKHWPCGHRIDTNRHSPSRMIWSVLPKGKHKYDGLWQLLWFSSEWAACCGEFRHRTAPPPVQTS